MKPVKVMIHFSIKQFVNRIIIIIIIIIYI